MVKTPHDFSAKIIVPLVKQLILSMLRSKVSFGLLRKFLHGNKTLEH